MSPGRISLASLPLAAVSTVRCRMNLRHIHVVAEKSWKQRNAEAMDMEVSSDDEDESAPAAKKSRQPQQANDGSSLAYMQRVSRQPQAGIPHRQPACTHLCKSRAGMACSTV